MRLPNRKPGKYTFPTFDPPMTAAKQAALQKKLTGLKAALPQAIQDTQRYAENGDFSENAEYQIAKGRLRGLHRTIDELQQQLNQARLITPPDNNATVQLGHQVVLASNQGESTFQILGSSEANPAAGIISYQSPLGAALLGHAVGDVIDLNLAGNTKQFTLIAIKKPND